MHIGKAGCVAALSFGLANADFYLYTEPPIPLSAVPTFANPSDASSWTTSVFLNAKISYGDFTQSLGEAYKSSVDSARSEIKAFAASAQNYSIPAVITDDAATTSISDGVPDWYTALPSAVRQFKEQQVANQFSIVREVIADDTTATASSTGGAMPTPRAGIGAGFGAMAAIAAGVFL